MATTPDTLTLLRYRRINKAYTEPLSETVSLTLMLIPAGEFVMGTAKGQHRVRVSQFLMGRYPVTQAQWAIVAGYNRVEKDLVPDPSQFKGETRPVEQVSWEDATEFCQRLAARRDASVAASKCHKPKIISAQKLQISFFEL